MFDNTFDSQHEWLVIFSSWWNIKGCFSWNLLLQKIFLNPHTTQLVKKEEDIQELIFDFLTSVSFFFFFISGQSDFVVVWKYKMDELLSRLQGNFPI